MLGVVFSLFTAILWGIGPIFSKIGLRSVKPTVGALITTVSAVPMVWAITIFVEGKALGALSLAAVLWFAMAGVVFFALGRYFFFMGIVHFGVAKTSVISSAFPFFAIFPARVFLKEDLTVPIVLGTFLIVVGVSILSWGD